MNEPRTGLLQLGRIEQRGEPEEQFEERAKQEREEAKASLEASLRNHGSLDLDSAIPQSFRTPGVNWAGSHSPSLIGRH